MTCKSNKQPLQRIYGLYKHSRGESSRIGNSLMTLLSLLRVLVQSLVRELRSHKPRCRQKNNPSRIDILLKCGMRTQSYCIIT